MSDTTGGGEGGVAGAGQDEGPENEPPHLAPFPGHGGSQVRETSEEGAPPSAKRTKVNAGDQEQEGVTETVQMCGETQEATGSCLQEDGLSCEQSMVQK